MIKRALLATLAPLCIATAQRGDARAEVDRIIDSARVQGLPTAPLQDKALEGTLKGADDARIAAAVRSLARELQEARTLAGTSASVSLLTATASALHAHASPLELKRIIRASDGKPYDEERVTTALVVLVDIVAKRVPASAATATMAELMERGTPEGQLRALRTEVEQDVAAGMMPETSLRNRATARLRMLDPEIQRGIPVAPSRPPQAP